MPAASLDHLVGAGEERGRDRKAERVRSLDVKSKLEVCRLEHRQVCWCNST